MSLTTSQILEVLKKECYYTDFDKETQKLVENRLIALEKERDELRATVHTLQAMLKEAQRG